MPTQPSPQDALALAQRYNTFADAIVRYQADHGTDPDVDQANLVALVGAVTQRARTIASDAQATAFNDVANDLQLLDTVLNDANAEIATLTALAGNYTKIATIISGVLGIAEGLAQHDPASALKSATTLAGAL